MTEFRSRGAPLPDPLTGYALRRWCMEIPDAPEYRQAFWGTIWEMGNAYFWQKDIPADERDEIAAQVWREVLNTSLNRFEAGETCDLTDLCLSYPNTASFIQYFPNDPRYTPDLVPEGYNFPPWYFATAAANLLYGTQTGDIITSLDRFPPGSLPTIIPPDGLPTIAIRVNGAGRITVNLRTMFAGSKIQITRDNDPLTAYYVNVLRDIASLPPDTVTEIAVDIDFDMPGEHVAHLVVVSSINDQLPFLFHGAGLVSVDLCGLMPTLEETPMYGAVRLTVCGLEQLNTSTLEWEHIADVLPLTAGPDCALTDGLYIDAPNANPSLVWRQDEPGFKQLWRVATADETAENFRSFLYNAQNSSGADNVVFSPYSYNLLNNVNKANSGDISWLHNLETRWLTGGQEFTELYWEYRGAAHDYRPLMFQINKNTDYGQFLMFAGELSYLDAFTSTQFFKAQLGHVQLMNGTTLTIQTNAINAISQKMAGSAATLSLLQLDALDQTIIGRQSNPVISRGNPTRINPGGDANEVLRADFTAGVRRLGFFGSTPAAKQVITGASIASALNNLINKLELSGLITDSTSFEDIAPVLAVRQSSCHLQVSLDGENWDDVPGGEFLPLNADIGCNVVTLTDPGYLIVRRMEGSTETGNPVLRLQTADNAQGDSLPLSMLFDIHTTSQLRTAAYVDVRYLDPRDGLEAPEMSIQLTDFTATRRLIGMAADGVASKIGFLGANAIPVQRLDLSETDESLLLQMAHLLENFGFARVVPCIPIEGDWAIEWHNTQLHDLLGDCGETTLQGVQLQHLCPTASVSSLDVNPGWTQGNNSTAVYIKAEFALSNIDPIIGILVSIAKDPGGPGSQVLASDTYYDESYIALEWSGEEEFSNIGFAATISAGLAVGNCVITGLRIEGYGEVPDAVGGDLCG